METARNGNRSLSARLSATTMARLVNQRRGLSMRSLRRGAAISHRAMTEEHAAESGEPDGGFLVETGHGTLGFLLV